MRSRVFIHEDHKMEPHIHNNFQGGFDDKGSDFLVWTFKLMIEMREGILDEIRKNYCIFMVQ